MRAGWNRAAVGCEIFSMARRHRHACQRPALNRGFATATLPRPRADKSLDFYIRTSFKSRSKRTERTATGELVNSDDPVAGGRPATAVKPCGDVVEGMHW